MYFFKVLIFASLVCFSAAQTSTPAQLFTLDYLLQIKEVFLTNFASYNASIERIQQAIDIMTKALDPAATLPTTDPTASTVILTDPIPTLTEALGLADLLPFLKSLIADLPIEAQSTFASLITKIESNIEPVLTPITTTSTSTSTESTSRSSTSTLSTTTETLTTTGQQCPVCIFSVARLFIINWVPYASLVIRNGFCPPSKYIQYPFTSLPFCCCSDTPRPSASTTTTRPITTTASTLITSTTSAASTIDGISSGLTSTAGSGGSSTSGPTPTTGSSTSGGSTTSGLTPTTGSSTSGGSTTSGSTPTTGSLTSGGSTTSGLTPTIGSSTSGGSTSSLRTTQESSTVSARQCVACIYSIPKFFLVNWSAVFAVSGTVINGYCQAPSIKLVPITLGTNVCCCK